MRKFILMAALFAGAALPSQEAALRLPALISDHMVIQRDLPAHVWGWAKPGESVSASMNGISSVAKADDSGRFSLKLKAMKAGGPYTLTVNAGSSIVVNDVLVGEVWFASGQSNMEFAFSNTSDAAKEIPLADHPMLRLFQCERHASALPEEDLKGSWKLCTPENAKGFSAVAYHFGKNIHRSLKIPVGMIASSWGGTPAEAWTPRAAFDAVPELAAQAKSMEADKAQLDTWSHGHSFEIEIRNLKVIGHDSKPLELPKAASASWGHSEKPGSKTELKAKDESGRFSGNVEGGGWASMSYSPAGGAVDLSQGWVVEFEARGKGTATVLLHPKGAADWDDFGSDTFELGSEWKAQKVHISTLKQGGWGMTRVKNELGAIEAFNFSIRVPYWPELPAFIYNGMAAPVTPYAIKGAIWYQGESNAGRAAQYSALLGTMIKSWRAAWGIGDFPFLIVQLPDYAEGNWDALRQAQVDAAMSQPACGLVATLGLGEAHNIHPRNKTPVGERLSNLALSKIYKMPAPKKGALVWDKKILK